MDKFAEDLAKEVDVNAWKLVDKVLETGFLARKEFSQVVDSVHSSWKKPLWALWKYFNQDLPKEGKKDDEESRKLVFSVSQKEVIKQILASLNSKKDFEVVQTGLASGISWENYKPANRKKIDD